MIKIKNEYYNNDYDIKRDEKTFNTIEELEKYMFDGTRLEVVNPVTATYFDIDFTKPPVYNPITLGRYSNYMLEHINYIEIDGQTHLTDGVYTDGKKYISDYLKEKFLEWDKINKIGRDFDFEKEDRTNLLYNSLDVISDKGSVIANQFIVEVDNENKEFTIYSEKNPSDYKEFKLPFKYLSQIGKIDGDGNNLKLTKHKQETINKKLESYKNWKTDKESRDKDKNELLEELKNSENKIIKEIEKKSVLTFRIDKKDYQKLIESGYFKNFKFSDGKILKEFNPFIEDNEISDLIKLSFFKSNDNEYRVIYNESNSLIYSSEYEKFIENIYREEKVENLKSKEIEKNLTEEKVEGNKEKSKLDIITEGLDNLSKNEKNTLNFYLKNMNEEKDNRTFGIDEIYQIYLGMKENINYKEYAKPCYNSGQMNQIRQGIIESLSFSNGIENEKIKNSLKYSYRNILTPKLTPKLMQLGRISMYVKYKSNLDFSNRVNSVFTKSDVEIAKTIFADFKYLRDISGKIKTIETENNTLKCILNDENKTKIETNNGILSSLREDRNVLINKISTIYNIESIMDNFGEKALNESKIFRKEFLDSGKETKKTEEEKEKETQNKEKIKEQTKEKNNKNKELSL